MGEDFSETNGLHQEVSCGTIAVLTTVFFGTSHFPSEMLERFQSEMMSFGYGVTIYLVGKEDLKNRTLPYAFDRANTAGIVCIEMFDRSYSDMLCELGIPLLLIDAPASCLHKTPKADRLLMENRSGIRVMVEKLAWNGKKRIGFIGQIDRCQSFLERYLACREALILLDLPCEEEYSITGYKDEGDTACGDYREYLMERIKNLKELPDVFFCASDTIAFDVLGIFRELGISVPGDVCLCGFGDSQGSAIVTPPLTTVRVPGEIMGVCAVQLLLSRMQNPFLNYRTFYTETMPVYRESLGKF